MHGESEWELRNYYQLHQLNDVKNPEDGYVEIIKSMVFSCPNRLPQKHTDVLLSQQNLGFVSKKEFAQLKMWGRVDCDTCLLSKAGYGELCCEQAEKIKERYGEVN